MTCSWIGASFVAMKRVPMLTPSAPSASAATRPRASAKPPEAMNGIFSLSAVVGMQDQAGHVVLAGVAGAFEAVDRHRIDAEPLRLHRVPHRRAFMDDLDPGLLEDGDVFLGVVAGGLDDFDAAADDRVACIRHREPA